MSVCTADAPLGGGWPLSWLLFPRRPQETGGRLTALEAKLEDDVKVEAKAMAAVKGIKDSIKAEEKKKKQLHKSLTDVSLLSLSRR